MNTTLRLIICIIIFALLMSAFVFNAHKSTAGTSTSYAFTIDTIAQNMVVPWEIVFLPDSTMLFTERDGKVRLYRNNQLLTKPALTTHALLNKKTGLLGMCLHPDFSANHWIYLAYNYEDSSRILLKVLRYSFDKDTLINPITIIDGIPGNQNHTGCRLKFGPDKKLFISTGDADKPMMAQDLKAYNGKILRVNDDGSIPADNPFVNNDTALQSIWSYGHRNCQGLAFQPGTNTLFNTEHGPTGGDEINIIQKGANYGWPVIHHRDTMAGMISPLLEYTPSIGPAEAIFYTGKAFPSLQNHLLVACLRGESIINVQLNKNTVISQEMLPIHGYGRIRALTTGPDGFIYFSTSEKDPPEGTPRAGDDMVLRIRPAANGKAIAGTKIANSKTATATSRRNIAAVKYTQLCASCHGNNMQGTEKAQSLIDGKWNYGAGRSNIIKNIKQGITKKGMPAWEGALKNEEIEMLAAYILEKEESSHK